MSYTTFYKLLNELCGRKATRKKRHLHPAERAEIEELFLQKPKWRFKEIEDIAREYGVSAITIYRIARSLGHIGGRSG